MSPTHSDDPPYEMKGNVMPVIGTRLATTAMFTQAWNTSHVVMPAARSAPVASRARVGALCMYLFTAGKNPYARRSALVY